MSLNFDAYHKWLGIPPEEQPPHYYRLLGLKPFETDADVIDSAADQRLAHLRSFTTGARAQFAQQILNEVAAARVCLLDPQTRAEYDSELRTRLRAEEIAGTAAVQAIPVAQPLSELDPLEDPLGPRSQPLTAPLLPHVPPPKVSARSNSGTLWPLFAGIAAVVLLTLGGAIAAIVFSGVFDPQVAVNPSDPPAAPHVAPVEPIGERPSSEPGEELPENRPSDPAPEPPIEEPPAADPPADPAGPSEEQPTEPTAGESEPEPPLPQPGRLAIPSAEQQQGAKAKLEEVFDLNGPRNTAQKKLLVRELRNLGLETSLERPIERWVLLRQSIDLGVELADARIVLDTVGELARDYEFDAHSVKQAFLLRMAGAAADADSLWEVVEQGKAFADAAAAAENFETALAVYEALYRACQKPFGRDYRKLVFDNRAEIVRRKEAWERLQQHIAVLANNPEDPVANLAVGRWELFERNDFAAALPFLAKSNGPALREAALAEMNGAPDSDAEMAIADAWFDASQAAEGDSEKETLNHRAGRWYQRAEASVTSQLTRVKIQKRLAEIGPIPATAPSLASSGGSNTGSQSIAGILSRTRLAGAPRGRR